LKTILCIPGKWENREDFLKSIITTSNGRYIFAGQILLDTKTDIGYELEIYERDDALSSTFEFAHSIGDVLNNEFNDIKSHNLLIYIIGDTGNEELCKIMANTASALLTSGGIAINVETSGKAFGREQWQNLLNKDFLYEMFVEDRIFDNTSNSTYSCGMHNFGFKDTIITGVDFQEAQKVISIFHYYQRIDNPNINDGQTFSIDKEAPIYKIVDEKRQNYIEPEVFINPFGIWRLEKLK